MSRREGFTVVELLVVIAIIAVLAAILFPAIASAKRHGREPDEASRMRQVYLGLAMYEDESGEMPPVLGLARPYVGEDRVFATSYPVRNRAAHGPYPPAAFTYFTDGESPFPIDFGYLKTYPPYDENRAAWRYRREEPLCGLIASPWAGEVYGSVTDHAGRWNMDVVSGPAMRGPVLRIKMDGSLYRLARNPHSSGLGDVDGLFYHPLVRN